MRISPEEVKKLCRARGTTLTAMLRAAGVSRNAYYSLARKRSVVPRSVMSIAACLRVPASSLLEDSASAEHAARDTIRAVDRIMKAHPECDRDTVRHTLLLLREKPVDRLRRALLRGRKVDILEG